MAGAGIYSRGANWRELWAAWEGAQYDIRMYKAGIKSPFALTSQLLLKAGNRDV